MKRTTTAHRFGGRTLLVGTATAACLAVTFTAAGCSSDTAAAGRSSSSAASGTSSGGASAGAGPASPAGGANGTTSGDASVARSIVIAKDVAQGGALGLAQPITVSGANGATRVVVTGPDGLPVDGVFDAAAGTWTAKEMLHKSTTYAVSVTVTDDAGHEGTARRRLATEASGAGTTGIHSVTPYTNSAVGNAQPIVLTFSQPVPTSARASVQSRFVVHDTAGVEGAWRWVSPTRLDYRPKDLWPMGDTVSVTGSIQNLRIGSTWGAGTLGDVGFTVASDLQAVYDPSTHVVTVTEGGKTVRTMKSDGGKKGFESLTGRMVVLGKQEQVRMRSCSVGISCTPGAPNYYDEQISHAVQISTSGTYLHAAPWDAGLGKVDSSHGCLHLSEDDAKWFYAHAMVGDLVTLKGSSNPVSVTNGEGDWNLSWQQWTSPTS